MWYSQTGRMRFERWITKATDIYSEYITLITLPLKQWAHEHALIIPTFPIFLLLPWAISHPT
jgi:hypothetical protein